MIQHPRLGEALQFLHPKRSYPHPDPWEVGARGLFRWPTDLGPEPTLADVEAALTAKAASKQAKQDAARTARAWARDVRQRWGTLTAAERQVVLQRVFEQLFAVELEQENFD